MKREERVSAVSGPLPEKRIVDFMVAETALISASCFQERGQGSSGQGAEVGSTDGAKKVEKDTSERAS
jgi:hypothetical protein